MVKPLQSIRGMNDILPPDSSQWHQLESLIRLLLQQYGYEEIRTPILEATELFKRTIGEVTDIVEKEMYTFEDRNGDSLSMRPEGTASIVRAGIEGNLFFGQVRRLWYCGPMFRHERPQSGRYRQFHQIGVETFGMAGPEIDAELVALSMRLWRRLGLTNVRLQINSLGTAAARQSYRAALVEYFAHYTAQLDEDSRRRLTSNPLRILDSKDPVTQGIVAGAPALTEYLSDEARDHFELFKQLLDELHVPYEVNTRLVRGLDYYNKTVFEWVTDELGAQGTICAGGRYDGLVAQLGGKDTPAVGFAIGLERVLSLCLQQHKTFSVPAPHLYIVAAGKDAGRAALRVAEMLREQRPWTVVCDCTGGSIKSQLKRADKSNAAIALILGEREIAQGQVGLKPLRLEGGRANTNCMKLIEGLDSDLQSALKAEQMPAMKQDPAPKLQSGVVSDFPPSEIPTQCEVACESLVEELDKLASKGIFAGLPVPVLKKFV